MEQSKEQIILDIDFDSIVESYGKKLFAYCFHMLRNKVDAEDAVQEVFTRAHQKQNSIKNTESIQAWLYKTAYNYCLNLIKRRKLITFIPFVNHDAESYMTHCPDILRDQLSEEIEKALKMLTPDERTVLLLRTLEDRSYEAIADIMDKSSTAVRKQYERAKNKIIKYLNEYKGVKVNETVTIL